MLEELIIRNFAIIDDLTIQFDDGLTILSGETGAGKSIIISAVNLLLGSRASADLIRSGADTAELQALFRIPGQTPAAAAMTAHGYDPDDGLMIRRIISRKDRHRTYINGALATVQVLTAITATLASISGQHAHQILLKEDVHLDLLDQYGRLTPLRRKVYDGYHALLPLLEQKQRLIREKERQTEQIELLRFQRQEIAAADIGENEDVELEDERTRLSHARDLFQTVHQCIDILYGADGAVAERLGEIGKALEKAARIDSVLASSTRLANDIIYGAEDLHTELQRYVSRTDLDPARLETVEERLDTLNRLKRKYGGSLDAVRHFLKDADTQLREMENIDTAISDLEEHIRHNRKKLFSQADELSRKRARTAGAMAKKVEQELASLKMAQTRFQVALESQPAASHPVPELIQGQRQLGENGFDRARFMIAPNVGETIKPLASIASGGELSRVVLALKAILTETDAVATVVFDEVDAGIGGSAAEVVGKKVAALARHHQVLCITHLPQIAKYGHHHFRIAKTVSRGRTRTTISALKAEQRVEEIARMLGGETITDTTMDHARELLAS